MLQVLVEISGVFIESPSYGYKKEEKEINDLSYLINFLNLIKHKKYKELEKPPSFYAADYYNKDLSIYGFEQGYYPNYYPVRGSSDFGGNIRLPQKAKNKYLKSKDQKVEKKASGKKNTWAKPKGRPRTQENER
ncbi:hypothetical protein FV113G1_P20400 (plasmid) [Fusobacterium varium]|nr:hypothetical protein FV113G1_P20400 [Fusobacterium varium]